VTYNVKIAFDTDDSQIKSGMSVNASIIIDVKQDVLIAPNSAVKIQGTDHYVETIDNTSPAPTGLVGVISSSQPNRKNVVIGIADDSYTEIVSGLNEGDQIISKTSSPTTTKATTTAPSLFGGGGGAGRALGH
jgi:multidrug efflux pump subunit AcrA (membrane-fusion protein)